MNEADKMFLRAVEREAKAGETKTNTTTTTTTTTTTPERRPSSLTPGTVANATRELKQVGLKRNTNLKIRVTQDKKGRRKDTRY